MTSFILAAAGFASVLAGPRIDSFNIAQPYQVEDAEGRSVELHSRDQNLISPYGGARFTITGAGFHPAAEFSHTNSESEPTVILKKSEETAGCPNIPCQVIPHYLSNDQIVCEVPRIDISGDCTGYSNWKLQVSVDAEDSNLSGNINLRNGPWLNFFSGRKGPIVPEEPTGSWTQWFNMDTPVSADQEHEGFTDEVVATLIPMGCQSPIGMEVREVSSGAVVSAEDMIGGFGGDCFCHANIYVGLWCYADPDGDDGTTGTCNTDHEVRYYCGNNVIDWYADNHITHDVTYANSYFGKDIDMTTSLIHQPALYDAQGFKLAECSTNYEENGVTKQIQGHRRTHWGMPNHYRCQLKWSSGNPTVGSFKFQWGSNRGYAGGEDQFVCNKGNEFNFQVHPKISSVSPSMGSIKGGTRVTVFGEYLQGDVEIRVGGVACENVVVNADKTEATCTTTASLAGCSDGDTPVENQNCITMSDRPWRILNGPFCRQS